MTQDEGSPILDPQRRALGERRFHKHMELNARLQAMILFSNLSVWTTPGIPRYSDDALDAMKTDADDVLAAAQEHHKFIYELADDWRAQRQEATP